MRSPQRPTRTEIDQLRKLGYETRDVALPTLVRWFIGLGIFIAAASVVSYGIYVLFVPEIGRETAAPPGAFTQAPPAPNPEIQALPKKDLASFRREEDFRLTTYGWADQQAGTVRVPIDDAMAVIAQRGLPKALPGPIPPATGAQQQPAIAPSNSVQIQPGEPGSQMPAGARTGIAPQPGATQQPAGAAAPQPGAMQQPPPDVQPDPAGATTGDRTGTTGR